MKNRNCTRQNVGSPNSGECCDSRGRVPGNIPQLFSRYGRLLDHRPSGHQQSHSVEPQIGQ